MDKPPFVTLRSVAVPLDRRNVDTDQIIPARFLRKPRAAGMAPYLFHDLRFDSQGALRTDFILNDAAYEGCCILVALENFGSGSSREAAVYALWDYGIRVVIAPSFGDIFYSNSLKNGLLPIVLPMAKVQALLELLKAHSKASLRVSLDQQTVTDPSGTSHPFEICPFQKVLLTSGQDELGYTVALQPRIEAFEKARASAQPWL